VQARGPGGVEPALELLERIGRGALFIQPGLQVLVAEFGDVQ